MSRRPRGMMAAHRERLFGNASWDKRRRVIYLVLLYCAVVIAYLVLFGSDMALHQQIATGLIGLAGATVGSYCFAAVWDDKNKRDVAAQIESVPPDPPPK